MGVVDIEAIFPDTFSWTTHVEQVRAAGPMLIEGENKRKDGSTFPVEVNVKYVRGEAENYTVAIARDITERKRAEQEYEKLLHDTGERVKELAGLYGVARAAAESASMEELFRRVSVLLPPAWQYPEITRCRILFDRSEYLSEPFEPTRWKQTADIRIEGEVRGTIEIYYLKESPLADEGSFLAEERNLISGLADLLSVAASRVEIEEKLRESEQHYRAIAEDTPVLLCRFLPGGKIVYVNEAYCKYFARKSEELIRIILFVLYSRRGPGSSDGQHRGADGRILDPDA